MLAVRNLTVQYGAGRDLRTAVDDVTLDVPVGGTLGLVGESGSGKSTIAKAIVGLVPAAAGTILLDGTPCEERERNGKAYRRRVQMVFQDPFASLNPRMPVGDVIREALRLRGLARGDRRAEVLRVLELVGLGSSALSRYPHQFSGGQRQRIAIARALAVQPDVIVMDEVTSALDVSIQATILNLLKLLQRELRLSFVFISHDLAVVGAMSDAVAVLYLGSVVEQSETKELFATPRHPYTRGLLESVPRFGTPRVSSIGGDIPNLHRPPQGCRFHTRCPVGPHARPERTVCMQKDPRADALARVHHAACHFAERTSAAEPGEPVAVPDEASRVVDSDTGDR